MKIIGRTSKGYLIEATETEISHVAGFRHTRDDEWRRFLKLSGGLRQNGGVVEGTEIPVSDLWNRLGKFRESEESLKRHAQTLHAMAEMLEAALPSVRFPEIAEQTTDQEAAE